MAQINVSSSLGTNTGRTTGDIRMGRIKAIFPTRGLVLSEDDLADSDSLFAALQANILIARALPNKVFIVDGLREADDNTGDPQTATLGDGTEEVTNEAVPKYTFKNTKGTAEQQAIVSFNGWKDPVFFLDDKNVFWYRGAANRGGQGFSIGSWYGNPPRPGSTGNANVNILKLAFGDLDEFKTNVGALKVDWTAAELQNLVDVKLSEVSAASGYAFHIAVHNDFAGTSAYDAYNANLNVVGAWKATLLSDGSNVTIASVAAVDSSASFTVTLASSPTIASSAKVKLELVDPAALAALTVPVIGIESRPLKITKP